MSFIKELFLVFVAHEVNDWARCLPAKLIRWSARRFAPDVRDRYAEEWLAHCADMPTTGAKLCHSFGCIYSAVSMNDAVRELAFVAGARLMFMVAIPIIVIRQSVIEVLMGDDWKETEPERARLRRLQMKSDHLIVLGLDRLELTHSDHSANEASKTKFVEMLKGVKRSLGPHAADMLFRELHRGFSKLDRYAK